MVLVIDEFVEKWCYFDVVGGKSEGINGRNGVLEVRIYVVCVKYWKWVNYSCKEIIDWYENFMESVIFWNFFSEVISVEVVIWWIGVLEFVGVVRGYVDFKYSFVCILWNFDFLCL